MHLTRKKYNKRWRKVWSGSVRSILPHSVLKGTQQRAIQTTWCLNVLHTVTASLADSAASTSPYITSEQHGDSTGTHSPPCSKPRQCYGAPRGTNRGTSRPAPVTSWCLGTRPALPGRCRAVPGDVPVPAGGYRTIRHGLLCAVTKCFSLPYRVTPTTDLCVLFLLAVSNHSPAVWVYPDCICDIREMFGLVLPLRHIAALAINRHLKEENSHLKTLLKRQLTGPEKHFFYEYLSMP